MIVPARREAVRLDQTCDLRTVGGADDADHEGRDKPRRRSWGGSGPEGAVTIPPATEDELRNAVAAGRRRRAVERRAASVRYDADRDAIEIELTDGAAVRLPRAMVEEFRDVSPADMTAVLVSPGGYGIKLDKHDINIGVHGLIGVLATAGDMGASRGKLGGAVRSKVKSISARANGAKGGRPRKHMAFWTR